CHVLEMGCTVAISGWNLTPGPAGATGAHCVGDGARRRGGPVPAPTLATIKRLDEPRNPLFKRSRNAIDECARRFHYVVIRADNIQLHGFLKLQLHCCPTDYEQTARSPSGSRASGAVRRRDPSPERCSN